MTWKSEAWLLEPVAAGTGPFTRPGFLQSVAAFDDGIPSIWEAEDAALALVVNDVSVAMTGSSDLCDYRSPLGPGATVLVASAVESLGSGRRFEFDSLPLAAAEVVAKGMAAAGLSPETEPHTEAAVLHLPPSFDAYLESIGKKQRHELRRKRRRYEEVVGLVHYERCTNDPWAFSEFARLHRLAPGDKGTFMASDFEAFFAGLHAQPGWGIDLLRHSQNPELATACLFSFIDESGYYLYNSSYDLGLAEASPGNVVLGEAIKGAIELGLTVFDFLKGDEPYKFRLGAESRPLFKVTAQS